MKLLLLAESQTNDIALRATTVALQITHADGGEDGRVEWSGGVTSTDYFPSTFCIFQAKAGILTDASIKRELLKKSKVRSGRGKTELNQAILEKKNPSHLAAIEVYDANKIATWVNSHPAVASGSLSVSGSAISLNSRPMKVGQNQRISPRDHGYPVIARDLSASMSSLPTIQNRHPTVNGLLTKFPKKCRSA